MSLVFRGPTVSSLGRSVEVRGSPSKSSRLKIWTPKFFLANKATDIDRA